MPTVVRRRADPPSRTGFRLDAPTRPSSHPWLTVAPASTRNTISSPRRRLGAGVLRRDRRPGVRARSRARVGVAGDEGCRNRSLPAVGRSRPARGGRVDRSCRGCPQGRPDGVDRAPAGDHDVDPRPAPRGPVPRRGGHESSAQSTGSSLALRAPTTRRAVQAHHLRVVLEEPVAARLLAEIQQPAGPLPGRRCPGMGSLGSGGSGSGSTTAIGADPSAPGSSRRATRKALDERRIRRSAARARCIAAS